MPTRCRPSSAVGPCRAVGWLPTVRRPCPSSSQLQCYLGIAVLAKTVKVFSIAQRLELGRHGLHRREPEVQRRASQFLAARSRAKRYRQPCHCYGYLNRRIGEGCFLRGATPGWSFKDAVPIDRHIIWENEANTSRITFQLYSNRYPLIEVSAGYRRLAMQKPCLPLAGKLVVAFTEGSP